MLVRFRLALTAPLLAAVASSVAFAQRGASHVLDRANLDTTCAPCTDFYQFANGGLAQEAHDPARQDEPRQLRHARRQESGGRSENRHRRRQPRARRRGEGRVERLEDRHVLPGVHGHDRDGEGRRSKPIKPTLDAIAAAKTTDDVVKLFGSRLRRGGGGGGGRGGGGARAVLARTADRSAKQQDRHSLGEPGRLGAQSRRLPRARTRAPTSGAPTTSTTSRARSS